MNAIGKPFGYVGPVLLWNASGPQSTKSTTTTRTQDEKISTGAGSPVGVYDSSLSTGGGALTFTSSDPTVAKAAIDAANNQAIEAYGAAAQITGASNAIASQVADAPRLFTQKTILWVVGAVVVVVGLWFFSRRR